MLIFRPVPESHDDLLEHASNRDSQEPAQQSEEFCAREEREQGHNGMNSHGFAEDAWPQYLPQDNPLEKRHIHRHNEHHHPPLWQSRQDRQRRYHNGTDHRDKEKEEEKHSQQCRIWDVQQREPNAGPQGAYQRLQQRATKVPAQALIEIAQEEVDRVPLSYRRFVAEPAHDARAVNHKVDAERDHQDEGDEVAKKHDQERKQARERALRLSKHLVLELDHLAFAHAKLSQGVTERLKLALSSRAQKELDILRERRCLPNERGGDDKHDRSQDTCYQQIGNGDGQRRW